MTLRLFTAHLFDSMARPNSPKTIVSRLFAASQRPIYILDGSGRIVFSNQALADWLGVPGEQLQGLRCVYATSDKPDDRMASRLAVPPQAREAGEYRSHVSRGKADGSTSTRSAVFFSLHDTSNSTLVVLADVDCVEVTSSPFDSDDLHRQVIEMRKEWGQAYRLDQLVGASPAMRQIRSQIQLASNTPCRVVVVGQQGTGRETIARTIHQQRTQGRQMLVPFSCELLDAETLQSTLETLVKQVTEMGDDTSTVLLLLEVDQLSMESQSVLLGFLEIVELGLETLSTSRSSLKDLVEQEKFRAELACHLASLEIRVPSLCDRLDDIPLLAQWSLERSKHKDRVGGFAPETIESLLRYGWPREIAELNEVVAAAAANAKTAMIEVLDLPKKLAYAADAAVLPDIIDEQVNLDEFMAEVESELISRALRHTKGNRAQAARALGVSRGKLLRRIEQLGIESP